MARVEGKAVAEAAEVAASTGPPARARQRVPAAERRDALIDAAIEEFAQTGLHGTPVDRIARRVGVAQPYVFSLFPTKRELFIAAAERCFERVTVMFEAVAAAYDPAIAPPGVDVLETIGIAYQGLLGHDETMLRLQLHGYAACADPVIRDHIRLAFTQLLVRVQEATGAPTEKIDEFIRYGMWINVAAALDVSTLSKDCSSITEQLLRDAGGGADGAGGVAGAPGAAGAGGSAGAEGSDGADGAGGSAGAEGSDGAAGARDQPGASAQT